MPQMQFPIFPTGVAYINSSLAFIRKEGTIYYFNGNMPVFHHEENDVNSFRMITSQFYLNGVVSQSEIIKAFGVPSISVKRAVKIYRTEGPSGFYKEHKKGGGPRVLKPDVIREVENLLEQGEDVKDIAANLDIKLDTLQKAIRTGKIKKKVCEALTPASSKSERSIIDSKAPMGMGATNTIGRIASSLGNMGPVGPQFESALDVPNGGVLFGLPALLAVGLLRHTEKFFKLPNGYYGLPTIFLLLAFMAFARQKFAENLRYVAPGEWGKLLGLDRVPEAKILREKVAILTQNGISKQWNAELCKDWMNEAPEEANTLYVDGHVRVYHGSQTKLPKHYVSRDKLCARATMDYWVNALDGKPFFLITKPIDPGMLKTLEEDIVPRLEKDIPNQPTEVELENNPLLHRFTLVFDREGYSTAFFIKRKRNRIACITYNKNQGEDWPLEEFSPRKIKLQSGEIIECKMAERGVFKPLRNTSVEETKEILGENYNKKRKGLWVREIRKLKESGQQGSIITTDYINNLETIAFKLFSRWSQENFFGYMMKHYGLDRVFDYGLEKLDDTTKVINPEYRRIDSDLRRLRSKIAKTNQKFGLISMEAEIGSEEFEKQQKAKSEILEEKDLLSAELEEKKTIRKSLKKHIFISDLPDDLKFDVLNSKSKHFIDTIKMIAYRAETATVNILKEEMTPHAKDEARSLMRAVFENSADLIVNEEMQTLTVKLHNLANHSSDRIIRHLCEELNSLEMKYPGTNLQLIYKMISDCSSPTIGSTETITKECVDTRIEKEINVENSTSEVCVDSYQESEIEAKIEEKKDQILTPNQLSFW